MARPRNRGPSKVPSSTSTAERKPPLWTLGIASTRVNLSRHSKANSRQGASRVEYTALLPREIRDTPKLHRAARFGIGTCSVAKGGMRTAPGPAVLGIVELDENHLVRCHVRKVPPAMIRRMMKDGGSRH